MKDHDTCGACKYFVETEGSWPGMGNCRRYAPKPGWGIDKTEIREVINWAWPHVSEQWQCGEFELHYLIDPEEHDDLG